MEKLKAKTKVRLRKHTNWSKLGYIGRNPISRLIVFAPVVAQILIYKPELALLQQLDLKMLDWAYWSLIFFAAGQLIYTFACPDDLKAYPNRHDFIQSLNNTETDELLRTDAFSIIRKCFGNYGGSLEINDNELIQVSRDLALEKMKKKRSAIAITNQPDIDTIENLKELADSLNTGVLRPIDWHSIVQNPELLEKYISSNSDEKGWAHLHNFKHHIKTYAVNSHWRVNLLDLRFQRENISRPSLRSTCAILYFIGMSYFVYSGLTNMIRVFLTYWS